MRRIAAALVLMVVASLSGCAWLAGMAPSVQHCEKVEYDRDGDKVTIKMKCKMPLGGSVGVPGIPGL